MSPKVKYPVAAMLLFLSSGFNTASAVTADEVAATLNSVVSQMNQIFGQIGQAFGIVNSRLNSLDSRVSNLESANPNFGGYGTPFSADGALKNVVLSRQIQPSGDIVYYIRSRYASSTEMISIDGVLTQRPFIANYASVVTDSFGNILSGYNYIEAPDTENYVNIHVEESNYDAAANKTVIADSVREQWPCNSAGGILSCLVTVIENATGNITDHYTWTYARTIGGPMTVNGMTFNDVRIEEMISANFSRVRAKGIGEVLRMTGSGDRELIYYRSNGATGGSVAGTPFDAGQPFDGVFF